MTSDEKKEKMELLQMFFVKSFWLSFVFLLIGSFMCVFMHDYQLHIVSKWFGLDEQALNWMVVLLLGLWKILIFQFTLVPALVIWCMRKCCKCGCGCSKG